MGLPGSVKANPRSENRELVELGGTGWLVVPEVSVSGFRVSVFKLSGFGIRSESFTGVECFSVLRVCCFSGLGFG